MALFLAGRGYTVTGSDSAVTRPYTEDGISVTPPSHSVPNGTSLVVYSLAVDDASPELRDARERGILPISRAQLLGALMSTYSVRVSVSGSHGKSTTTAAIEHVLSAIGRAHTAVSGALFDTGRAYTDLGGDIFLAEACEYKDSFLRLCPTHQIITSIELDHTDYFATLDDILASFRRAADMAHTVIINADDYGASTLADELRSDSRDGTSYTADDRVGDTLLLHTPPVLSPKNGINTNISTHTDKARTALQKGALITYGRSEDADYRIHSVTAENGVTRFCVTHGESTATVTTPLLGEYNLYNLTAAIALLDSLGIPLSDSARELAGFRGIERRASLITHIGTVPVYYDYAHHPSEIRALLVALKERYGTAAVIFRPHTYSRTASLWADFVSALSLADGVILLDVYPAREEPIPGISSRRLAEAIDGAVYCESQADAARLSAALGCGVIALVGAGEVETVREGLIALGEQFNKEK